MSLSGSSIALRFTAAICLANQAQGMHLSDNGEIRQHFDQEECITIENEDAPISWGIAPPSEGRGFGRFADVCLPQQIAPVRAHLPRTRSILGLPQTASWGPISLERPISPAGHHSDIFTASAAKVPEARSARLNSRECSSSYLDPYHPYQAQFK